MDSKLVGIVGPIACGKGVITRYLIDTFGFTSFSLSTLVHEEAKKRGVTIFTRTTLQNIGDEMRRIEGDGVLAIRAIKQLKAKKIVIEGIRNPGEVNYLRTIPGFYLIAVDATPEIRFQRILQRGKAWDPKDWESFKKVDGRDGGDSKDVSGQQVRKCMSMADVVIENNGDLDEVKAIVDKLFR